MRLIDVDKLMFKMEFVSDMSPKGLIKDRVMVSYDNINEAPTVEAVPIELYEQVKGERDVAVEQLKSLNIELFEKPYLKAIPVEWLKKHKCSNVVDLWERECRLKDTEGILKELLSEHNFKSYSDYVEYAGKITALPQGDRLDVLFKEKENETN